MLIPLSGEWGFIGGGDNGADEQRMGRGAFAAGKIGRGTGDVGHPAMQRLERLGHSFPGQSAHIYRLGLVEKFRDISCTNCAFFQARFKPFKPECCQH